MKRLPYAKRVSLVEVQILQVLGVQTVQPENFKKMLTRSFTVANFVKPGQSLIQNQLHAMNVQLASIIPNKQRLPVLVVRSVVPGQSILA